MELEQQVANGTTLNLQSRAGYLLVFTLACLSGMTALSIDIYIPSMPHVASDLGVSTSSIQSTLSLFVFCYGIGQLFFGPISDRYGRRWPLMFALVLYLLASVLCAMSWSGLSFGLGRALQGLGACAASVAFVAISRDCFSGRELGRVLAIAGGISSIAPFAAPLLGAELDRQLGWRSGSVFLAICGGLLVTWIAFTLPETSRPKAMIKTSLTYRGLFEQPGYTRYAIVNAAGFCAIFAYLSTSSGVLIGVRGLHPSVFSFWFAANAVFNTIGCVWAAKLLKTSSLDVVMRLGGGLILAGALGILALGHLEATLAFMGPMFVLSLGVSLVMPASAAAAMEPFEGNTAKAAGFLGFARFSIAGAMGAALSSVTTVYPMGAVMALSGLICFALSAQSSKQAARERVRLRLQMTAC
jgi:DHA1 family bicyclomycin/chloramphenicol resistance-like MFS transporter